MLVLKFYFETFKRMFYHFWQIVLNWYAICTIIIMKKLVSHRSIMKLLDWAYEKAISDIPGLDSASELAQKYMLKGGSLLDNANSLIRWQNTKAGASGFVTGIGGMMTLPVAIPANLASVLYIQIRMIAAIAYMGGYNLRDEKVKTLVYICLAGNFAKDIVQETSIKVGTKLSLKVIEGISEKSILSINQRVGFRLIAIYGEKGLVNLSKAVPFIGGAIGGTIDSVTTNIIGNMARNTFLPAEA